MTASVSAPRGSPATLTETTLSSGVSDRTVARSTPGSVATDVVTHCCVVASGAWATTVTSGDWKAG